MMKNFLSIDQKKQLQILLKETPDGRESDRIKAILLADKGWKRCEIAEAQFRDDETVSLHIREYMESGKLTINSGGSESKLTKEQASELRAHLEERVYSRTLEICNYVEEKYGLKYSQNGMTSWLHRNNFSYKKAKGIPAKADHDKQEAYIAEYKKLKQETPASEPILHMDAMHPTMNTKLSYGWIRTGTDKIIPTTASRTRVNILGAINLKTMALHAHYYDTIDSTAMEDFLNKLRAAYPEAPKIHLIADNGPYNKSIQTKEAAEKLNIILHFLPPYSPNLNPIERVWKVMNEKTRNNQFFESAKEFRQKICDFFEKTWPEIANSMKSRISDNFSPVKKPVVSC